MQKVNLYLVCFVCLLFCSCGSNETAKQLASGIWSTSVERSGVLIEADQSIFFTFKLGYENGGEFIEQNIYHYREEDVYCNWEYDVTTVIQGKWEVTMGFSLELKYDESSVQAEVSNVKKHSKSDFFDCAFDRAETERKAARQCRMDAAQWNREGAVFIINGIEGDKMTLEADDGTWTFHRTASSE